MSPLQTVRLPPLTSRRNMSGGRKDACRFRRPAFPSEQDGALPGNSPECLSRFGFREAREKRLHFVRGVLAIGDRDGEQKQQQLLQGPTGTN